MPFIEEEDIAFRQIRIACIPEVMLAYNTVLTFSARYLTRDSLLESMDLVPLIAAKHSELGPSFVQADRLPELLRSFAWSSKEMILAGKKKKTKDGRTIDLWTVKPSKEGSGSE